ncbi:MAG: nucleotidyltransferase domain-containing protein [Nanoarchaeota archaeon]|nr:nucleotidyltransferase domain-containing protein [Nanoarchaeota archaeon]MBU1632277.1 nucleotidyltransferase domain-containing protein [Nanoarchaeota archaeon]MBU1876154.1 nucleotidyltransferase domain-containing protein [Nanoarchaeota archaeon]
MKEKLKSLFFNNTLRKWHFETLMQESGISRERVNHFLKELLKEKLIIRIKKKGKMPYYLANRDAAKFRSEKRLYGLTMLEQSGLFGFLNSCKSIKTAILFGSFARGDWSKSSDIDLFIYGDDKEFQRGLYETKLHRDIQIFKYRNKKTLKKNLDPTVIPNIAKGFFITESIEPFEVTVHV